jgi:hypothetical protein
MKKFSSVYARLTFVDLLGPNSMEYDVWRGKGRGNWNSFQLISFFKNNFQKTKTLFPPTFRHPQWTAAKFLFQLCTTDRDPATILPDRVRRIRDVRDSGRSRCCSTTCRRCWRASQRVTTSDCQTFFPFIQSCIPTSKSWWYRQLAKLLS